jgi:uncharacterized protein (TIGR00730 family)
MLVRRICVFCGSNTGARPDYAEATCELGRVLVERNLELVYGGANVGLMGLLAHTVQELGGRVVGVIPQALVEKEVANTTLDDLRIVSSMHERKALMADLADGFIALPGGFGTWEEFFEVVTWAQLGYHAKPCGLLNIAGFYTPLLPFLDAAVEEQFVRAGHRQMVLMDETPQGLLNQFDTYRPVVVGKWNVKPEREEL